MIRELGGLGCAPLWAISTIMLKSQTEKADALQINALRNLFALVFVIAIVPIFGKVDQLSSLSFSSIFYLLLAAVVGIVFGDTFYIKGLGIIGVSKALPMSIIYPIFILPFSATIVGESLSFLNIAGVFITVAGLCLITVRKHVPKSGLEVTRKQYWKGIFLVLAASLCWAAGTITLNFAMVNLDPIIAGAIRIPFIVLVLFVMIYLRKGDAKVGNHSFSSWVIFGLAGILGIGLGGLLFMIGVKYAGPAKTAILSSTAPLFGMPLSILILREKITLKMVFGTILCVIGIWFVV